MPSIIDQRLAAKQHLRQIETMIRLERTANAAVKIFVDAGVDIVNLALEQPTLNMLRQLSVGLFQSKFREVAQLLANDYRTIADGTYAATVDTLIDTIPRNFFRLSSAALARFESVEDVTENEDLIRFIRAIADGLLLDNFTEPIAQGRLKDLSGDQWKRLLKSIIFKAPSRDRVTELINENDEAGRGWVNRLAILSQKVNDVDAVAQELATGVADGENQQQLRRRILPLVGGIVSSTKRIIRTEGLRVAERTQRETWASLGDMMIGAQILAVLDINTRPAHALRNGLVYFKSPTGDQFALDDIPLLPDEPNCRCWSTPVLRPPADLDSDPVLSATFRNEQGAGIPDPATYDRWFAGADVARRRLAVGTRRYNDLVDQLGGTRDPEWADFINPETGELLPRDTIKNESILDRIVRKGRVAQLIADREKRIQDIANAGFTFQ